MIDVAAIPLDVEPTKSLEPVRCIDCAYQIERPAWARAPGCSKRPVDADRDGTRWHWCGEYREKETA